VGRLKAKMELLTLRNSGDLVLHRGRLDRAGHLRVRRRHERGLAPDMSLLEQDRFLLRAFFSILDGFLLRAFFSVLGHDSYNLPHIFV